MIELSNNHFDRIVPLYKKEEIIFPLILAVIHQKQRGWIFVDDLVHPTAALVISGFGFTQCIGAEEFLGEVIKLFQTPESDIPSYLLWYAPPLHLQNALDQFTPAPIRRRERMRFSLDKQFIENPVDCPAGYQVCLLDKETIAKADHFKLNIGSRFWSSIDDFIEHGIGTCVKKEGEVISLCYSACVVDHLAEIDIVTREEYRGMGLAFIAGQHFISECIKRGITPTWDCFASNESSIKLAHKLGFTQTVLYPFYSFNIPIDLSAKN